MPVSRLRDILGQDHAVATLRAALESGRVHHAWIFSGPAGVGKRTAAVAFAHELLTPREGDASEVTRLLEANAHPDLHIVTKELARFHEDREIRERKLRTIPLAVVLKHVIEPARLAATMRVDASARKVFVIDEAEMMDFTTQNALLKTLEEPTEGTVIIMVTSSLDRLLPTIRSRCQRVAFGALDRASMQTWLDRAGQLSELSQSRTGVEQLSELSQSRTGVEQLSELSQSHGSESRATGKIAWAIDRAQGSPGRLLAAIEGGFEEWEDALAPLLDAARRERFSPEFGSTMARLVDDWAKSRVEGDKQASKDVANKEGMAHLIALLAEQSRALLHDAARRDGAHSGRVRRALYELELLHEAEMNINANVNPSLTFENLAAQLARPVRGDI